jgi:hypothetical protein
MLFRPDAAGQPFQLTAHFLLRSEEGNGVRTLSLDIPPALTNALTLTLPPEFRLIEEPGIRDAAGIYRLPAATRLTVKYLDTQAAGMAAVVEADIFTRINVEERRVLLHAYVQPVRPMPETVVLQAPSGAEYVVSSLRASCVKRLDGDRYELSLPPGETNPFSMEFGLAAPPDNGPVTFTTPVLQENRGQQGRLVVDEPDDAQVTIDAKGLVTPIPVERLGGQFAEALQGARFYMSAPPEEPISLTIKRFQPLGAPATVLECQYFFVSLEENGNILSVLAMDVPPEFGARLTLKAVPEARIWSLKVNGNNKDVYLSEQDTWVIPLDAGQPSHVELAFLRTGPKLGLQGALDVILPETGLASQNLRVGIALPERVDLLSLDGPVSSASGEDWKCPAEFAGKPHFFARSFHRGEGMSLSIAYKEPLNQTPERKGATQ